MYLGGSAWLTRPFEYLDRLLPGPHLLLVTEYHILAMVVHQVEDAILVIPEGAVSGDFLDVAYLYEFNCFWVLRIEQLSFRVETESVDEFKREALFLEHSGVHGGRLH